MEKNFTSDYDFAANIVQIAFDELEQHHATRNYTGLITRYYRLVEADYGDPRAVKYPFMDSPLPTIGMVLTYLAWVLVIGPRYMRDRKPMQLRTTLIYYNAFQVLLSGYMFYEHLMAGWLNYYNLKCQPVDYSDGPMSRRMLNLCYIYYLSKLTEFADTVFFVLRKKKSQITWLHVYHHSLTPLETWVLVKFLAGGNATFPNILNNFVHVCMYFYYMMAAMGPQYSKFLWWKKYMTELQIAQFILCIIHTTRALLNTQCQFSKFISALLLLNASIFFCLFMNFYVQNYNKTAALLTKNTMVPQQQQQQPQQQSQPISNGVDNKKTQ
ncbi:elongation of very long chain fatty acids protein 7 [Condylostylus longicornis]|uniref:elongation of very long chain fatty acids protein 7 n=1 Tax=Condylostylus longicornis TaxID=2530218 RepID=UPI00244E4035|nr:elongation of very long chain fatty acids protein 7 [Condylostylus longicornis]